MMDQLLCHSACSLLDVLPRHTLYKNGRQMIQPFR